MLHTADGCSPYTGSPPSTQHAQRVKLTLTLTLTTNSQGHLPHWRRHVSYKVKVTGTRHRRHSTMEWQMLLCSPLGLCQLLLWAICGLHRPCTINKVFISQRFWKRSCVVFVCSLFYIQQHVGSYQSGYSLLPVCTRSNFIVLPRSGTRPWLDIPKSYYPFCVLTSPCLILIIRSVRLCHDKYQFFKSLVWLGWVFKLTTDLGSLHSIIMAITSG